MLSKRNSSILHFYNIPLIMVDIVLLNLYVYCQYINNTILLYH